MAIGPWPPSLPDEELAILSRVPLDFWRDFAADLVHAARLGADGDMAWTIHLRGGRVSTWTAGGIRRTYQPRHKG